jgi:hypothetical protein
MFMHLILDRILGGHEFFETRAHLFLIVGILERTRFKMLGIFPSRFHTRELATQHANGRDIDHPREPKRESSLILRAGTREFTHLACMHGYMHASSS